MSLDKSWFRNVDITNCLTPTGLLGPLLLSLWRCRASCVFFLSHWEKTICSLTASLHEHPLFPVPDCMYATPFSSCFICNVCGHEDPRGVSISRRILKKKKLLRCLIWLFRVFFFFHSYKETLEITFSCDEFMPPPHYVCWREKKSPQLFDCLQYTLSKLKLIINKEAATKIQSNPSFMNQKRNLKRFISCKCRTEMPHWCTQKYTFV